MGRLRIGRIPQLARVPLALLALAGAFALFTLFDTGHPDTGPDATTLSGAAAKQVDRATVRLAEPGLYVAPQIPLSRLDGAAFDRLRAQIQAHPGQLRMAVLPASAGREATAESLAAALHDKVGEDGIYAVLVDHSGTAELAAYQWTEDRPYYQVIQAVTDAENCCARDYPGLVSRFVEDSADLKPRPWATAMKVALVLAFLVMLGIAAWGRWRTIREVRQDTEALGRLAPEILDELSSVERRAAGFPAGAARGNDRLGHRYAHARVIAKQARTQYDEMRTLAQADDVIASIADFRFQAIAIDALQQGRPAPERAPFCVVDPRHGPGPFTHALPLDDRNPLLRPTGRVCPQCAEILESGQLPIPRRLPGPDGDWVPYWAAGRIGEVYMNGYRVASPFPPEELAYSETGEAMVGRPGTNLEMTD